MLATLTVNVIHDDVVGDFDEPILNDGDLTLRDAIAYVNDDFDPGPLDDVHIETFNNTEPFGVNDTILFDPTVFIAGNNTITLDPDIVAEDFGAALRIRKSVTIDATMLSAGVTIDAVKGSDGIIGNGSSVFSIGLTDISAENVAQDRQVTLAGLTITGGDPGGPNGHNFHVDRNLSGGGISFHGSSTWDSDVTLTIRNSVIQGNQAGVSDSSGNGWNGRGGGLALGADTVNGGSVLIDILDSTIEANSTTGEALEDPIIGYPGNPIGGGGISVDFTSNAGADPNSLMLNLRNSTVSNNTATRGSGGGVFFSSGGGTATFNVTNTTISGNTAPEDSGGGLFVSRLTNSNQQPNENFVNLNLDHVTITDNSASEGGGLFSDTTPGVDTTLKNTIVSGNSAATGLANNIDGQIELDSLYNLIGPGGVTAAVLTGSGNIDNPTNDPGLLPLALNGGPTRTHAPLLSSPAVNTGDPMAQAGVNNVPLYDQRGETYDRVADGRIDIGAVEVQTPQAATVKVNKVAIRGPNALDINNGYYSIPTGSGLQLKTVPLGGADTIEITFSESVDPATLAGSFKLLGGYTGEDYTNDFTYQGLVNNTATWDYTGGTTGGIPTDQMVLVLSDTITDATSAAVPLDGEWVNPIDVAQDSTGLSDLANGSGDSTAGGDFQFLFTILHGDLDTNNKVNIIDFGDLADHFGHTTEEFFTQGDIDGDQDVDIIDFGILSDNFGLDFRIFSILPDFNGHSGIEQSELDLIEDNIGMTNATLQDGDLNDDGSVTAEDLAFAQILSELNLQVSV